MATRQYQIISDFPGYRRREEETKLPAGTLVFPSKNVVVNTAGRVAQVHESRRHVWLLQRKAAKPGATLGKTTGWIHRATLKSHGVEMLSGVTYDGVDDRGLHITVEAEARVLEVDHVILCAGQEPLRDLEPALVASGVAVHRIGGADVAAELDAKRAIDQGSRLAARF